MSELPPPSLSPRTAEDAAPDNVVLARAASKDLSAITDAEAKAAAAQDQTLRAGRAGKYSPSRRPRWSRPRNFAVELLCGRTCCPWRTACCSLVPSRTPMPRVCWRASRPRCGLLEKSFESAGLQVVDPTGQPFNPEHHGGQGDAGPTAKYRPIRSSAGTWPAAAWSFGPS